MFKMFERRFDTKPLYEQSDVVYLRYDLANRNGVALRGTLMKISGVHITGCGSIRPRYSLEDPYGNLFDYVDEAMLTDTKVLTKTERLFSFLLFKCQRRVN